MFRDRHKNPNPKPKHKNHTNAINEPRAISLPQLHQATFTHSKLPNPHARKKPTQTFHNSYWHSYPEHNLHTASCQTPCQEDIAVHFSQLLLVQLPPTQFTHSKLPNPHARKDTAAHFSQLLLAQLPRTQFTHSKLPNPHARKTSPYIFRSSYWHSYPQHSLHTASCQTRMPGRHRRILFAAPIGTATPNTVYTQQAAKPACQQDIAVHFSHLLLAHLLRTQFAHSKLPNPMPGRHRRTFFAGPIGTATPNTLYTQQAAKPACQEYTNAKFSHLLLAQLPRIQFTHNKAPNPHARKTSPQYVRISYCQGYPQQRLHTASCQTRMPGRHQRRPGAPQPFLEALSTAPATQKGAAGQRRPGAPQLFLEALSTAPAT